MTRNWDDPINKKKKRKKNIGKKNALKKDRNRLGLILQIYYLGHESEVTSVKVNKKKQRSKILNQTNIEG
jgi:hypothetical protein